MGEGITTHGGWLEKWSAVGFLAAGALLFGYAVLRGIELVTETTFNTAIMTGYAEVALLPLIVGLIGLYPRLNDSAPRLSLAGLTAALSAGIGLVVLTGWLLGAILTMEGLPAIPEDAPAWTTAVFFLVFLTLIAGFLLFSVASLRTGIFSRTVGLLLVVPPLLWIGFLVGSVVAPAGHALTVLVYTPMAVALAAIWHHLRTERVSRARTEPMADSPTR